MKRLLIILLALAAACPALCEDAAPVQEWEGRALYMTRTDAGECEYRIIDDNGNQLGETFYAAWGFSDDGLSIARDKDGYGLVNTYGEFVLAPEYSEVTRPDAEGIAGFERAPYFVTLEGDGILVLEYGTLREIGRYECTDEYLWATYMNPALFMLESWSREDYVSMETGEILFSRDIPEAAHDFGGGDYEKIDINGFYEGFVDGLPQRLVITDGERPDTAAHLTDNAGERVGGDFQYIKPLVWNGEAGVFMCAKFDPAEFSTPDEELYFSGEATLVDWYGAGFRAGLIDENGNELVPMEYANIEAVSLTEFALTDPEGNITTYETPDGQ